ncbi:MAG: deoxyribose-phosphate aldolase [Thermodesulfobacteriota bacterium]
MTIEELANRIDLTILNPLATKTDVEVLARKALAYPFASLCLPPCHAGLAARLLAGSPIKVCTVVGFPLGYEAAEIKVLAARKAVDEGAQEIDMVMNQSAFHGGEYGPVEDEIANLVSAVPEALVKVIIETCYLDEAQKARAAEIIIRAGARFIKTSTGFGKDGAIVEDVRLLSRLASGRAGVKAAGGIKTLQDALAMIEAGAERIGTSSGIEILEALKNSRNP